MDPPLQHIWCLILLPFQDTFSISERCLPRGLHFSYQLLLHPYPLLERWVVKKHPWLKEVNDMANDQMHLTLGNELRKS